MKPNFAGHSINIYFDRQLEKRIISLWQKLYDTEIASYLIDINAKPHISLAAFQETDPEKLTEIVTRLPDSLTSFPIKFAAIGAFPTQDHILFLSATPSEKLITAHNRLHEMLAEQNITCRPYYRPGNWIPHCTVAYKVHPEKYKEAFQQCFDASLPYFGKAVKIGICSYLPVKELVSFDLKSSICQ